MLARIPVTCTALGLLFVFAGAVYAANANSTFISPLAHDAYAEGKDLTLTPTKPVATATPTPSPTAIPTPSPTATPTPLRQGFVGLAAPTNTPTDTPTPTSTNTPTPSPTATPTPVPVTSSDLENWFSKYSGEYSVDREQLKKIAVCESGFNSQARNGDYGGMYQFSTSSWQSTRASMSMDTNPDLRFNAEESIRTAAFKISTGGAGAWPSCK